MTFFRRKLFSCHVDPDELSRLRTVEVADDSLFKYTNRISIELSNLCNYAAVHKKCPLNVVKDAKILPARIVFGVFQTLERHKFTGVISFHTYNEPLIDPRLVKFIEGARESCPDTDIYICTNGYYLDQNLAEELVESGVSSIRVSAYTKSEFERLSKIHLNVPYKVELTPLDNRLNLYDACENDTRKPCLAPLNEIIITRDGHISLCCLDWKRIYSFGDLYTQSMEDILKSGKLHAVYERLRNGDRFLDLCKRCGWSR